MKLSKVIYKILAVIFVYVLVENISIAMLPVYGNEIAISQMSNDAYVSVNTYWYQQIWNYTWVVPVVFALILFRKEFVYLISRLKEIFKNEKN